MMSIPSRLFPGHFSRLFWASIADRLRLRPQPRAASLLAGCIAVLALTATAGAQVKPAAFRSPISLTLGGEASIFQPQYGPNTLGGITAYADLNLFHGIGVEGEARWLRFHEFYGISQDNYLVGPRVQVLHIWRAHPHVKALGGFSNMNFGNGVGTGRFTTLSFGGGVDLRLTRRISIRAIDAEYQYWPQYLNSTLSPYGVSAGLSYRIF